MIQAKYFTNIDGLNEWLAKNDRFEFLKFFSRSPDYFFVVYEDPRT
jgi:hypothetical protein